MPLRSVFVFLLGLLASCGDRDTNPIGQELAERSLEEIISLPPVGVTDGRTQFDGVFPFPGGLESTLLVGRMSGQELRAMLRFPFPADSLAVAAGAPDRSALEVLDVRLTLSRRAEFERLDGVVSVEQPDFIWDEFTVLIDTLALVGLEVPSTPIPGAGLVVDSDSTYAVTLPTELLQAASDSVEVLLAPASGEEFLAAIVSRNELPGDDTLQRPSMAVSYRVSGVDSTYETESSADTYWVGRDDQPSDSDVFVLSSVVRLVPVLRFAIPDSIPTGATVISTKLDVDVDFDRSLFGTVDTFPFGLDGLSLDASTGDTIETRFNTWAFEGETSVFDVNQALVQGWISGDSPNLGVMLKPRIITVVEWVSMTNPRLVIVYSPPPAQ
jgi:hypothetical protein